MQRTPPNLRKYALVALTIKKLYLDIHTICAAQPFLLIFSVYQCDTILLSCHMHAGTVHTMAILSVMLLHCVKMNYRQGFKKFTDIDHYLAIISK